MRVVAAIDKFRGTLTARQAAEAVAWGAAGAGWDCVEVPLADGGEGTLDVLGGPNRRTLVSGPLGDPVEAEWALRGGTAIIEMARASGLSLVGGSGENDPVAASTAGTGELIAAALDAGAKRIIVCLGGSATTDGGLGAQRALYPHGRLRGVELLVACDVRTRFVDAAEVFAPQKGATPAQVAFLRGRLQRLAQVYRDEFGIDVSDVEGGGAAGGLAGGLYALGARLVSGFDVVAEETRLADKIEHADLVITGEGFLDEQSFEGKVVGGVVELASELSVPVLIVAGEVFHSCDRAIEAISLVDLFGRERALTAAASCIEEAVTRRLSASSWS